jgi:hypothetical protein
MCVRKGKTVDTVNARNTLMGVGAKRERQKGKKKVNIVSRTQFKKLLGAHFWENCWGPIAGRCCGGPLLGELLGDRTTLQS